MCKRIALAVVCGCLLTSAGQAGLQSALNEALAGNVHLTGVPILVSYLPPFVPIPEGATFIDPVASTHGQGVFRSGPDFEYDPVTGRVSFSAPPMLGPADEFGIRKQYAPQAVRILARDHFADTPSIPLVTQYHRFDPAVPPLDTLPRPATPDDPSFVSDAENAEFQLNITPEEMRLYFNNYPRQAGFDLDFPILLETGLEDSTFVADIIPPAVIDASNHIPQPEDFLPEVAFLVDYVQYPSRFLNVGFSNLTFLAVPAEPSSNSEIPEPGTFLLAALAIVVTSISSRHCSGRNKV